MTTLYHGDNLKIPWDLYQRRAAWSLLSVLLSTNVKQSAEVWVNFLEVMNKHFTVYFDTSFYVNLCRSDEDSAIKIIDSLNALKVRHVLSDIIIRELLKSPNRTKQDEALVARVAQFSLAPYKIREGLDWNVLLLTGRDRFDLAELLTKVDKTVTEATSLSIMARRKTNKEQSDQLSRAERPLLQQYGFPEDMEKNPAQVMSAVKNMLDGLGVVGIEWPEDPTPEYFVDLSQQILSLLDPDQVASLEQGNKLKDSSTITEDRPFQVATRIATEKTKKRLGNTLRDTEHISLFVEHNHEIDLLQVDGVHEKIISRSTPIHYLREIGLANRCFSANSLQETVDKIFRIVSA